MTQAKNIDRFSIVKLDNGIIGVFERKLLEVIIIEDGVKVGCKIHSYDMLEVIKTPAQLAFDYLQNKKK